MKLNKFRIGRLCIICMLAIALAAGLASAAVTSENKVYMLYDPATEYYSAQAYFQPSHKVVSGEGYDLEVGKYVKQAYVRARADGLTILFKICSSYDSQRRYSREATQAEKTSSTMLLSTPEAKVKYCSTCTQRLNYGWVYF